MNYDDWKSTEPEQWDDPRPRSNRDRFVCRCGWEGWEGMGTGMISRQTLCPTCYRAESAEHLRRMVEQREMRELITAKDY